MVILYYCLPHADRLALMRKYRRAHWIHNPQESPPVPRLARGLMLVVAGCAGFVTVCVLWFVSQGWAEALFAIPVFIISVFAALLYRAVRAGIRRPPR